MSSDPSDPSSSTCTRAWLLGHKNTSFYSHTYHPPANSTTRAALVFIHGFAEHVERYEHVHKIWADKGFFVLAFDLRGFGRTALSKKRARSQKYGRTCDDDQIKDIKWGLKYVRETIPDIPVFLMGHSMGGALVLSFATRPSPDEKDSNEKDSDVPVAVSGIIASSPCLRLTKPPRRITRRLASFARAIHPNLTVRASVKSKYLSHDPDVVKKHEKDTLIRHKASIRAVDDMLNRGENLLINDHKKWPTTIPVLILHGTADKVCSVDATKEFVEMLPAEDKRISLYKGGYHELHNEPDGVKERFTDECIKWAEAHLNREEAPQAVETAIGMTI